MLAQKGKTVNKNDYCSTGVLKEHRALGSPIKEKRLDDQFQVISLFLVLMALSQILDILVSFSIFML